MSSIFISSTFQDMQQERDILQREVLPKIKDFVKQYGRNIELCDLRWGVNSLGMDEETSAKKVLEVCFDEIDKARPFFVSMIGERYGWIPPEHIAKQSVWGKDILPQDMLNKSVTEMEIFYAAQKQDNVSHMLFYFRNIKNGVTSDDKENKQVLQLKREIFEKFPQQVREYSVTWNPEKSKFEGMEEFAQIVYQDLKQMIIRAWGVPVLQSDYDRQFYQYQYEFESKDIMNSRSDDVIKVNTENYQELISKTMTHQNYLLVSKDELNLKRFMSALIHRYERNGYDVIPYDCGQSVLSSSVKNMLEYFTQILRKQYAEISKDTEIAEGEFYQVLDFVDEMAKQPVILAISNLQYLDRKDAMRLLNKKQYRHIHFLISNDTIFSMPLSLKNQTEMFYFQENTIFDQNTFIHAYMKSHHKEIDTKLCNAMIEKAEKKDNQYLEFLMQRLIHLNREDYQEIMSHGDGMEKISEYLRLLVQKFPNNSEEILRQQMDELGKIVGISFMNAVLAILITLPYGISRHELQEILNDNGIDFNTLDMSLLQRRFSTLITETLDGYYRMVNSPAKEILTYLLAGDILEWENKMGEYLENMDVCHLQCHSTLFEFYRSQYLYIAYKTKQRNALAKYLYVTKYEAESFSVVLLNLLESNTYSQDIQTWMIENAEQFSEKDMEWFIFDFYRFLSEYKLTDNQELRQVIYEIMKTIVLKLTKTSLNTKQEYKNCFYALYHTGELAFLNKNKLAQEYLLQAKKISRQSFEKYPNRIWKMLHGIELTEEEKKMGQECFEQSDVNFSDGVILGFQGELEDCDLEMSWTNIIRVIDNYLVQIYKAEGNLEKAAKFEEESKRITGMSDPNPFHTGQNKINAYTTIEWPDKQEGQQKHSYMPEYRRNSAIQISKEAQMMLDINKKREALEKYQEANQILEEMYEDGKTGEYYDLKNVENPEQFQKMIQTECARDLGLNYKTMLYCIDLSEISTQVMEYIDKMISYGVIYDEQYNNMQSKSDLEESYLLAARIYASYEEYFVYYEKILQYIRKYYEHRIEAFLNGQKINESIMSKQRTADEILYMMVMEHPEIAPNIIDFLVEQNNNMVKANDYNGFLEITSLVRNMTNWMWKHSLNWRGTRGSLEDLYLNSMPNQSMIWEANKRWDKIQEDAEILIHQLKYIQDAHNITMAAMCIEKQLSIFFNQGKYREAAQYGEKIRSAFLRVKDSIPQVNIIILYNKILAGYTESEQYENAFLIAKEEEELLQYMLTHPISEEDLKNGSTETSYQNFIVEQIMTLRLNQAVLYSKMGNLEKGKRYLTETKDMMKRFPNIAYSQKGLMERVAFFETYGLPTGNDNELSESAYRQYKKEIECALNKYLNSEYSVADLQQVEQYIEKIREIPQTAFYGIEDTIARYYHELSMLYKAIGKDNYAHHALKKGEEIAAQAKSEKEIYAIIYCDLCGYEDDLFKNMKYLEKAINIYRKLFQDGKKYSKDSYAMCLYNRAVLQIQFRNYQYAIKDAENALFLWKEVYIQTNDESLLPKIKEAVRMIDFLNQRINL